MLSTQSLEPVPGDYIVTEWGGNALSRINATGFKTTIYTIGSGSVPAEFIIDPSGNYIVTEYSGNRLSHVTPAGARTVLITFAEDTNPEDVAVVVPVAVTLSAFDLYFASNRVKVVYPSDSTPKSLGCSAASVSDWLASMAVSSKLRYLTEGLDTNPAFVN